MSTNEARVPVIPNCDICNSGGKTVLAAYDGKTRMGPWAYMCQACFVSVGTGLGTGRGQRLVQAKPEPKPDSYYGRYLDEDQG